MPLGSDIQCPRCKEHGPMVRETHFVLTSDGREIQHYECDVCATAFRVTLPIRG